MKIDFTEKQYKLLVKMIYFATQCLDSSNLLNDFRDQEVELYALNAHIDSHFRDFGFDPDLCSDVSKILQEETFGCDGVDSLVDLTSVVNANRMVINSLTMRDLNNKFGTAKLAVMDEDELENELNKTEERYRDEFHKNGFDNLFVLSKDFQTFQ